MCLMLISKLGYEKKKEEKIWKRKKTKTKKTNSILTTNHQGLPAEGDNIDLYIPIFTMISFVVVVGWLKVAQKMLDPYADGEDDVRFDLHWVLHRNVEGSFFFFSKFNLNQN